MVPIMFWCNLVSVKSVIMCVCVRACARAWCVCVLIYDGTLAYNNTQLAVIFASRPHTIWNWLVSICRTNKNFNANIYYVL